MTLTDPPALSVDHLTFSYDPSLPPVFRDLCLNVRRGSRTLLVGANGAGKSTLLRILAGMHMVPDDAAKVDGRPAFRDTLYSNQNVAFLGDAWTRAVPWVSSSVPYSADIPVHQMVRSLYGDLQGTPEEVLAEAARRDRLLALLDIDPNWRMHNVSDGQRKRVMILLKLLRPYRVLLLDEVTTHLDVIARTDFLSFLREESELRGATILYATHIFDGLEDWATDMVYLSAGTIVKAGPLSAYPDLQARIDAHAHAPLLRTVEEWLRRERDEERRVHPWQPFFHDIANKKIAKMGGAAAP
jgi:CCR4-NOT complex subunit CAF16